MKLEVETDKRVNIYALWEGRQLLLCKRKEKYSKINQAKWIALWPTVSKSEEYRMLKQETPKAKTEFKLSDEGVQYLQQILSKDPIQNNFIAKVEYISINGLDERLWQELSGVGEFNLWDVKKDGPMRYFNTRRGRHVLAFYRVYKIGTILTRESTIPDRHGKLSTYYKKINEVESSKIICELENAKPVLSDEAYNQRKNRILQILKKYPPKMRIIQYRKEDVIGGFEIPHERFIDTNVKYCFNCGTKLISEANYCIKCGKKQNIQP